MQRSDFQPDVHGELVPTVGGALAYVPRALPPAFAWTNEVVAQLSQAERMIGRLQGALRDLENPRMLVRPMLAREAVASSQIEGTQATLQDIYKDRAGGNPTADQQMKGWIKETRNAESALRRGMKLKERLPVAKQLWLQLHATLMEGVRGGQADPGAFRRIQNWIGPPRCDITAATYVPPPPQMVLDCLSDLERFIHHPSELPRLVRLAMIHYQFEAIHPFIDGNGRLGRLINTLLMAEWGILVAPPVDLSTYFKRRQQEYYHLLLGVSQRNAWDEWTAFFLRGLAEQAGEAYARAQTLIHLRRAYRRLAKDNHLSRSSYVLIDHLFTSPYFTVTQAAKWMNVTYSAARNQVTKLEQLGLVKEQTGQKRNKVYLAERVFEAISETVPLQAEPDPTPPSLFEP